MGKAKNLKKRVSSYFRAKNNLGPRTQNLIANIDNISYIPVQSELEAFLLEANLIKKYLPKYNVDLKDGKAYPFIKITLQDEYPRVTTSRHLENDGAKYFGPYPDTGTMKYVLRQVRHIFPYCSCKNHPKSCFYYHLGLCPHPVHQIDSREYRKIIKKIILFLEGKKTKIIKDLHLQMEKSVLKMDFENASLIKKQIARIELFSQKPVSPLEYEQNPNLLEDKRDEELQILTKELHLRQIPRRIECYDISNLSGNEATGSLVVLSNGSIDKHEYRRFRIKTKKTPDDYAMLKEVFRRRFKNDWQKPDLIVVDGGLGQLRCAVEVMSKLHLDIPVIGLAKRLEEIYTRQGKLILNDHSPALHLLMRVRDEAHRFAKNYHLLLRSKKFKNQFPPKAALR